MGLLNKLKNVLFEEEEIEIPNEEPKEEAPKKEKDVFKKKDAVKMTFDTDEDDILSDRELFKAEPTFNFPMFDEQEFEQEKKEEIAPVKPVEKPVEVKTRVKIPTVLDMERGRRATSKEVKRDYKETRKREVPRNETHTFTPSPVISPVYGVLDKNYKKEDIVLRSEEKKVIDVDSVRKKAFGTLEEDIEKTLVTPTRKFYESDLPEEKNLDELLETSAEEIIPVIEEETKTEIPSFNIEEESVMSNHELEVLDRPQMKSLEEKLEDETLENDLFDLIDSMYETREDGE